MGAHLRSQQTLDPPADLWEEVSRSARIGQLLHEVVLAGDGAARAMPSVPGAASDTRLRGRMVVADGERWLVHYLGREGDVVGPLYTFAVPRGADTAELIANRSAEGPAPLDDRETAMVRARATALAADFRREVPMYDVVVLPGALRGVDGWLVYLLADTTDADEALVGGHARVEVDAVGGSVVTIAALSSGLSITPRRSRALELEAVFAADPTAEVPAETHVLASCVNGLPLYVATARGVWIVDRTAVRYLGR